MHVAHKELELLCSHNALLTQWLADCTSSTSEAVLQIFENALDQIEYFYHSLTLSKKQIWSDQAIIDGKIVTLRK